MSLAARMVLVLTTVGLLSGTFLMTVGLLTKDRIALNKKLEIERAIMTVVPGSSSSRLLYEEKDLTVYGGMDAMGSTVGYAVYASGVGFQDKISLVVGIDKDLTKIHNLAVLEQKETPGLGAKITDKASFLIYWEGRDFTQPLRLRKPPVDSSARLASSEVNTITGATISSQAVVDIVNSAREKVKKLAEAGKLVTGGENAR